MRAQNPVVFTLSGCPRIGLINESNIGMTWYELVAENVRQGVFAYSLLLYQIS